MEDEQIKMPKDKSSKPKAAKKPKTKKTSKPGGAKRLFPSVTLAKSLAVAQKIKDLNGGNPWSPADVAAALEIGPKSPKFFYVTAAARDFGLTTGTRDTDKISLTDLGRAIVYAPDPKAEYQKKLEAFLS